MLDKAIKVFQETKKYSLKVQKYFNWLKWVEKLAIRQGFKADIGICAYGQSHLVSKPKPIGGGWMFFSKACDGCEISALGIKAKNKKYPKGAPNCALLESPLFTKEKIKENQIIKLPYVFQFQNEGEEKLVPVLHKALARSLRSFRAREINPHAAPPPESVLHLGMFDSLIAEESPPNIAKVPKGWAILPDGKITNVVIQNAPYGSISSTANNPYIIVNKEEWINSKLRVKPMLEGEF